MKKFTSSKKLWEKCNDCCSSSESAADTPPPRGAGGGPTTTGPGCRLWAHWHRAERLGWQGNVSQYILALLRRLVPIRNVPCMPMSIKGSVNVVYECRIMYICTLLQHSVMWHPITLYYCTTCWTISIAVWYSAVGFFQ